MSDRDPSDAFNAAAYAPDDEVYGCDIHRLAAGDAILDDDMLLIFGERGETAQVSNFGPISDVNVDRAIRFIDGSGVVPQLRSWGSEYRTALRGNNANRGRKAKHGITFRELLILHVIAIYDERPPLMTTIREMVLTRLSLEQLSRVGLDEKAIAPSGLYRRLHLVWDNFAEQLDPFPSKRNARMSKDEHTALREEELGDPNSKVMMARLDWFANTLLEASWRALPADIRARWKGNIAVDGTAIPAWGKNGTGATRVAADRDTAWHGRSGNHRVDDPNPSASKFTNGSEATLAVIAPNENIVGEKPQFPTIALAIAFHRPGTGTTIEGANVTASIHDRGHPAGLWLGDGAYAPHALPENLQIPVRKMGYEFVAQFLDGQLGRKGSYAGANQIEGKFYCPAMPVAIVEATASLRAVLADDNVSKEDKSAAKRMWKTRIELRKSYELKQRERRQGNNPVPMGCPASGPSPTVTCPLKPRNDLAPESRALLPILAKSLPSMPGKICTNATSVHFPIEAGIRFVQAFAYGTDEHTSSYGLRNVVEAYNFYLKDATHGGGGLPHFRRSRGTAKQYLVLALLVASANHRKIRSFLLSNGVDGATPTPPGITNGGAKTQRKPAVETTAVFHPIPAVATELSLAHMERRRRIQDGRKGLAKKRAA